jgi:S-formylglutathione hydrolase FrmB
MARRLDRRAFLLGSGAALAGVGGAYALVDQGILPGRLAVRRALGACDVGGALPAVEPGTVAATGFASRALGAPVAVRIAYPPGPGPRGRLPVCLFLHGRGGDATAVQTRSLGLPWFLAAAVGVGTPPFAIAGLAGGDRYWHARAGAGDAGTALLEEALDHLQQRGLDTDRVALLGVSMGGYGVILHAERLGAQRVAALGALSPALWRRATETAAGAFDDAADFAAHDVFAGRAALAGIPTRLDCGRDDPFAPACRAFLDGAPASVTGEIHDGCHDPAFWRTVLPDHLGRLGAALAG